MQEHDEVVVQAVVAHTSLDEADAGEVRLSVTIEVSNRETPASTWPGPPRIERAVACIAQDQEVVRGDDNLGTGIAVEVRQQDG